MKGLVLAKFEEIFGAEGGERVFFAPGRVNLIGEHTDYNGGHVFPCALTIGTYCVIRERQDNKIRFFSMNFEQEGVKESSLDKIEEKQASCWTSYPKGIVWTLMEKGYEITKGFDVLYYGTIPNGSGLSSSASIEVLTAYALNSLYQFGITNQEMALFSQYSENHYNGVNCGIMDQFAVAMGKEEHAIYLDTATLAFEYAPIHLSSQKIVIMNTNKQRKLGDSKYNERRSECQKAVEELNQKLNIEFLGDLSEEEFEQNKHLISSEIVRKRAKHAVYENQRTMKAIEALKNDDLHEFGKLMIASHNSLRDDYEVTGMELDTLVEEALKMDGVYGARMTGAGFGGCAVSIVEENSMDEFIKQVGERYKEKIGYAADFYVVSVGDGPKEL